MWGRSGCEQHPGDAQLGGVRVRGGEQGQGADREGGQHPHQGGQGGWRPCGLQTGRFLENIIAKMTPRCICAFITWNPPGSAQGGGEMLSLQRCRHPIDRKPKSRSFSGQLAGNLKLLNVFWKTSSGSPSVPAWTSCWKFVCENFWNFQEGVLFVANRCEYSISQFAVNLLWTLWKYT